MAQGLNFQQGRGGGLTESGQLKNPSVMGNEYFLEHLHSC